MGQYFKFVNIISEEISQAPVSQNYGLSWHCKMLSYTRKEIIESFQEAAELNDWFLEEVVAIGDYGTVVYLEGDRAVDCELSDWSDSEAFNFLCSVCPQLD